MAATQTHGEESSERANQLYWQSDKTVDEILGELSISRSALYSAVRPVPAGASCQACGERLVYTNRTNRAHETAYCPACGTSTELDGVVEFVAAEPESEAGQPLGAGMGSASFVHAEQERAWERWRHDLAAVPPERAALIGGAAALGVVVGAVAARAVRDHL
jgi:hypothetical protein